MSGFEIRGLEEFQDKLKTVKSKAPDRILDKLDNKGKDLRKAMKKNTPKKTGRLEKGYKLNPSKKSGNGYCKELYNKASHHHLVNNGHRLVTKNGKQIGRVEGVFYVEKTVAEEEGPIMKDLQSWLDEMFEELK